MNYFAEKWRLFATCTVLLASSIFGALCYAQKLPATAGQPRAIALKWLLSNCEVGEGQRFRLQMLEVKAELEPLFLEALERGPGEKELADLERASEARYQQRQEALKNTRLPLTDEDRKAAQAVTREQYVAQEKEDFVLRYKSQAVSGLGIVGGPKAGAVLSLLSKNEKSPLRLSALEALKAMAGRNTNKKGPQ